MPNDFPQGGTVNPLHELDADGNDDQRTKKRRHARCQEWGQRQCHRREEITDARRQQPGADTLPRLEIGARRGHQPRPERCAEQHLAINRGQSRDTQAQQEPTHTVVGRVSQAHGGLAIQPRPRGWRPTQWL